MTRTGARLSGLGIGAGAAALVLAAWQAWSHVPRGAAMAQLLIDRCFPRLVAADAEVNQANFIPVFVATGTDWHDPETGGTLHVTPRRCALTDTFDHLSPSERERFVDLAMRAFIDRVDGAEREHIPMNDLTTLSVASPPWDRDTRPFARPVPALMALRSREAPENDPTHGATTITLLTDPEDGVSA